MCVQRYDVKKLIEEMRKELAEERGEKYKPLHNKSTGVTKVKHKCKRKKKVRK